MNTADILVLAVLVLNGVIGAFRGFVWQVFRVGSLVLAFWLGNRYAQDLAAAIPEGWIASDASGRGVVAWLVIGGATYLGMYGLGYLLRGLIDKARLTSSDRSLGFLLGAAKGAIFVVLAFQVILVFFPLLPGSVQQQLVGGKDGNPPPSQAFRLHHDLLSERMNSIIPDEVGVEVQKGAKEAAGFRPR